MKKEFVVINDNYQHNNNSDNDSRYNSNDNDLGSSKINRISVVFHMLP